MPIPKDITILGAGLTGLSTAFHLTRLLPPSSSSTTRIRLIDSSPRVGGWIDSTSHHVDFMCEDGQGRQGDVVLESGPRTIRPKGSKGAATMLKMLRDLDLLDDIIPISTSHPAAKNRYLLDTNTSTLTALPSSPLALLRRQPPLLRGLFPSILSEPFQRRRPFAKTHTGGQGDTDETVDSFFARRFGSNIATNLASSMVHGIYATSSQKLSVRAAFPQLWDSEQRYGSVVMGMLRGTKSASEKVEEEKEWAELGDIGRERKKWALYGLKGGLGSLTKRLEDRVRGAGVEIYLNETVEELNFTEGRGRGVGISTSDRTLETDQVISALPPSKLSDLIPSLPQLKYNPSTSVGVVNLVYPLPWSQIHPEGFGYLIPRPAEGSDKNPYGILGVIFDTTALPTSPVEVEGEITKLTIMMGGPYWSTYHPRLSIPTDPEHLKTSAKKHLETVFPQLKGVKPLLEVGKIHKDCIPTYLPNHGDRLRELHHALKGGQGQAGWDRLSLVGNGFGGVGVNDCVYSAVQVANAIARGESVTGLERWANWI